MFPLSTVLFPLSELALNVFEPRYQSLTRDCLAGGREFGVVLIARGSEVGGGDQRVAVGTVAHIDQASPRPEGQWLLMTRGRGRIRVKDWLDEDPYPRALVEELAPASSGRRSGDAFGAALAAVRRARGFLSELGRAPALPGDLSFPDGLDQASWRLCSLAPLSIFDRQALLEIDDPDDRLGELTTLSEAMADDLAALLAEGS
jgi:uncharacterized protein